MKVLNTALAAAVSTLAGLLAVSAPAGAHPHVWVTMASEIVFAPDGSLTGVRHAWTFDDMFSAFATMGIETKKKGEFTRRELQPLAQVNVESLKEFDYFTYPRVNGAKARKDAFNHPTDYWLSYEPKAGELTLHFTLPFKTPVRAKTLDLEVYDPSLFVYFVFVEKDPVRLTGAPPQCRAALVRASKAGFSSNLRELFTTSEANAGMGAVHAEKIVLKCP